MMNESEKRLLAEIKSLERKLAARDKKIKELKSRVKELEAEIDLLVPLG